VEKRLICRKIAIKDFLEYFYIFILRFYFLLIDLCIWMCALFSHQIEEGMMV